MKVENTITLDTRISQEAMLYALEAGLRACRAEERKYPKKIEKARQDVSGNSFTRLALKDDWAHIQEIRVNIARLLYWLDPSHVKPKCKYNK